jgi:hypothetical protein
VLSENLLLGRLLIIARSFCGLLFAFYFSGTLKAQFIKSIKAELVWLKLGWSHLLSSVTALLGSRVELAGL